MIEARRAAEQHGARATVAKVVVQPNATNAVAARADGWLDARAPDEEALRRVVAAVDQAARRAAAAHGVGFQLTQESFTSAVEFDGALRAVIAEVLGRPSRGAHGRRPRLRHLVGPRAYGHALRPQRHRCEPQPGGVGHGRRLPGRGAAPWPG